MYVRFMAVTDDVAALAGIPPGPQLAAALGRIDAASVPNSDLLALLAAQSRQAAHEAARLLGVIAEVGRATPTFDDSTVERLDHPVPHAADEVRAALAWSRRAADRECGLAEQLVHDVPEVYAAFLAGDIDRPKARVFADHLAGLTRAQIATVCEVLLPTAGRFTPGQLVVRLRRLVAAIDPRHYERRYRKALRDRTVCAWLDEDGTAVLCARGLSPAQAQAAVERIDLMAHAARRAGHPSTLDQIRVDVLAGLLDGTLHHLDRDQIIAHLLTHRSGNDDPRQTDRRRPGRRPRGRHRQHRGFGRRGGRPPGRRPAGRRGGAGGAVHADRPRRAARRDPRPGADPRLARPSSRRLPAPGRMALCRHRRRRAAAVRRHHPQASRGAPHHRAGRGNRRGARAGGAARRAHRRGSVPGAAGGALGRRTGRHRRPVRRSKTGGTSTPTRTTGYPVQACVATPRSAIGPASESAAADVPLVATRTTRSSTSTAAPRSPPTWHRSAGTTTSSRAGAAGPFSSGLPACSSGRAHSAAGTKCGPSRSSRRLLAPAPGRTILDTTTRPRRVRTR